MFVKLLSYYKLLTNWILCYVTPICPYSEKDQAYHEHTKVCQVVTGTGNVTLTRSPQGFAAILAVFWYSKQNVECCHCYNYSNKVNTFKKFQH